jgi:hypothetical protein
MFKSLKVIKTEINKKRKPSLHGKAGLNIVSPRTLPAKSYPVSKYRDSWIIIPWLNRISHSASTSGI